MKRILVDRILLPITYLVLITTSALAVDGEWDHTTEPPGNPLTSNEQLCAKGYISRQRHGDTPTSIMAQSFLIREDSNVDCISICMADTFSIGAGIHTLQLVIMKDTDGNGIGDKPVGDINYFDLSDSSIQSNEYLNLWLPRPIKVEAAYGHHFELFWTTSDNNHALPIWQSCSSQEGVRGKYSGGNTLQQQAIREFPSGEILEPIAWSDLTFSINGMSQRVMVIPERQVQKAPAPPMPPETNALAETATDDALAQETNEAPTILLPMESTEKAISDLTAQKPRPTAINILPLPAPTQTVQNTQTASPSNSAPTGTTSNKNITPPPAPKVPRPPAFDYSNTNRQFLNALILPTLLLVLLILMMFKRYNEPEKK